ncbi:MAG: triose-phosphate isomerase [Oscillospiraceae bacterium]|nr:triose-phosphate isomerase [Oscillospiraceae bacterium]
MNTTIRKPIIAGNWKMNNTVKDSEILIKNLIPLTNNKNCDIIICVPFTNLETAINLTKDTDIKVGAQNCHFENSGAFTGEISPVMLSEMGVEYVIIGHSERRQYFLETDDTINKKIKSAISHDLKVILCIGESLEEREKEITENIVSKQLKLALSNIQEIDLKNIVIAYEPIWAIGTGKTATSKQANNVCKFIRSTILKLYSEVSADNILIQYGGSMNSANASELISEKDIDGGLIGGASLKVSDFSIIINAASTPM